MHLKEKLNKRKKKIPEVKKMAEAAPAKPPRRRKPLTHPPTRVMVRTAIAGLNDKRGSSLWAIKSYVAAHHHINMVRMNPFIRRYIKRAVEEGELRQIKGRGLAGRFKLGLLRKKKAKKPKRKKKVAKPKKPRAKKRATKAKAKARAAKPARRPKTAKKAKGKAKK